MRLCWKNQAKKAAGIEGMENAARENLQKMKKDKGLELEVSLSDRNRVYPVRESITQHAIGYGSFQVVLRNGWKIVARPWWFGTWCC